MAPDPEFILVAPDESHEKAYQEMMREWEAHGGRFNPNLLRSHGMAYPNWLANIRNRARLDARGIPHILLFMVRPGQERIYGAALIRYCADDRIKTDGGHIGYGIRPSERKKGYATRLLGLALEKCRELGLKRASVVCPKDNVGSVEVARNNGGVPEPEPPGRPAPGYWVFWFDL
jgi:predicted acetyltransferase